MKFTEAKLEQSFIELFNQKHYIIALALFLCYTLSAQTLQPTATNAVVRILVVDKSNTALMEKVSLVSVKNGEVYSGTSNAQGMVELLVPIADAYVLNLLKVYHYAVIDIPSTPYYQIDFKVVYQPDVLISTGMGLIKLLVLNEQEKPLQGEEVSFKNLDTQKEYTATTDTAGRLAIELPYNANYQVNFLSAPDYERFYLPEEKDYTIDYQLTYNGSGKDKLYPTWGKGLFQFLYIDLDGVPVANESFIIKSKQGNADYTIRTDSNGKASLLVPLGSEYTFSTPCYPEFEHFTFPDSIGPRQTDITFKAISSEEHERRRIERELVRIARDSTYFARQYSNPPLTEKEKLKQIEDRAIQAKKELIQSPTYFEEIKNTVNAVFYRHRNSWKQKIIVTDVTCSMDAYLDEVFLWHALELSSDSKNQYIFFNDGDGKPQNEKRVGATGGLYYTKSELLDFVISQAWLAKSFGCSGDGPENDFEALLKGIKYRNARQEIILIADNYSDVRDYSLISEINVPIRIILCGLDEYVNEQYLNLAYRTKGSIHSIEEDLDMLERISEGSEIYFQGKAYVFTKGFFIHK